MAVSIDKVYQKVLAISNKEQRGYITPQEFNLLADRAQTIVFDALFSAWHNTYETTGPQGRMQDQFDMLEERMAVHRGVQFIPPISQGTQYHTIFDSTYRLLGIHVTVSGTKSVVTEVDAKEIVYMCEHPLLAPTQERMVFVRRSPTEIQIYPYNTTNSFDADIIQQPTKPEWGYVIVNGQALYNPNTTVDFDMHPADEDKLIHEILKLAGVILREPQMAQAATALEQRDDAINQQL